MNTKWILTQDEKRIVSSLVSKGKSEQAKNEHFAVIDFDGLYQLLADDEISLLKKYLAIDPKTFGYKPPYLGLVDIPQDLVSLADQVYVQDGEEHFIPRQYLPREPFKSYQLMNRAMQKDIGKKLLVLYGYRSPARQVFMFFDILERRYDFDFEKTIKRVCFPAYSEHVYPGKQAIDFKTEDGTISDNFDITQEYQWLKKNAERFNFFESYPQDNLLDMMYEPWHWHYQK